MRSSSYLRLRIITRLLAWFSISLTVACQSQTSSVNDSTVNSISPSPTVQPSRQPSINSPSTNTSIPASPTTQPNRVKVPTSTSPPTSTSTKKAPIAKVPTKPSPKASRKAVTQKSSNLYQNQQMGVKFEYPEGYTVDASKEQQTINVWLDKDYQAVKSGKYQNTQPPSHLNISVEANPQKLSAEEWVKGNESFLDPEQFSNKAIAGKQGLAFRSSGLFEFEHLVIPADDGNKMIVISIAEGDKKSQKVLNKVASSLEVSK